MIQIKILNVLLVSLVFAASSIVLADTNTSEEGCSRYRVPVTRADLAPFAEFPICKLTQTVEDGRVVFRYEMPLALTGKPVRVEFKGNVGNLEPNLMLGPNGSMDCVEDTCRVLFGKIAIDSIEVARYLALTSASNSEFLSRLEVARAFKSDPQGVLFYRKR